MGKTLINRSGAFLFKFDTLSFKVLSTFFLFVHIPNVPKSLCSLHVFFQFTCCFFSSVTSFCFVTFSSLLLLGYIHNMNDFNFIWIRINQNHLNNHINNRYFGLIRSKFCVVGSSVLRDVV